VLGLSRPSGSLKAVVFVETLCVRRAGAGANEAGRIFCFVDRALQHGRSAQLCGTGGVEKHRLSPPRSLETTLVSHL